MNEKLKKRLESIEDTYEDFILGICATCQKRPGSAERVIEFIDNNKSLTSSDVVEFVTEKIMGIGKVYPSAEREGA